MKKYNFIMLLALCLGFTIAKAQYIVTKVTGKVKTENGNYIRPGTSLKKEDRLAWSSPNDKLYVVIIGKGEKIITPSPRALASNNFFTEALLSSIHQDSRSGSLSGRGEIVEKIPDALNTDAKSNHKIIFEQVNKFNFDLKNYPQEGGGVFFIEIDVPLHRPIIRKLKTNNDTLYINYADFVTETSNSSIKYSVGYHSADNKSQLVATFTPYFDLTNEMEGIIANTILAYQGVSTVKDVVRDSVYHNVYANSGKPNGILFVNLFNKYWDNKGISNNPAHAGRKGAIFDEAAFNSVPKLSASLDVTRDVLPDNFSLRQYAPPVGSQGDITSCTAWSTAYAGRTISYAVQHNYSLNNHYENIRNYSFSPDFVYNNIKNTPDCENGTAIPNALKFMKLKGVMIKHGDFLCGKTYNIAEINEAQPYKIKDYVRVNDPGMGETELVQKMKSLIVSKHALPFGMHIVESFNHVNQTGIWYPNDSEREEATKVKRRQMPFNGHAMCVIGYNDGINNGSFEVMNSWGVTNGNLGFYWISYDDFFAFTNEVYTIVDYEPSLPVSPQAVIVRNLPVTPSAPVTPPVVEAPLTIVPVIVTPKQDIPPTTVSNDKPQLAGSLEFMLFNGDGQFEVIPVNKKQVGERGQTVENESRDTSSYANYILTKPFYSHNKYKIKFNLAQPAYVYIIGMDKLRNYSLFPQDKLNESALIDVNNATLLLPNDHAFYTLDEVTGKEKMCIMVSKSPIDVNELNQEFANNGHDLYTAVRKTLAMRLLEMKTINYATDKIDFNTEVDDDDVLTFFIEINHL